jgi:hypothetical protein
MRRRSEELVRYKKGGNGDAEERRRKRERGRSSHGGPTHRGMARREE